MFVERLELYDFKVILNESELSMLIDITTDVNVSLEDTLQTILDEQLVKHYNDL